MEKDYRVLIDFEALEFLPRSGKRRVIVLSFLRELGGFAHLGGDFQMKDPESQRIYEVSVVGGFAITWWIDGPVNSVNVVDIRTAS